MSLKCSVCFLHRRLVLFLLRCQWRSWNILQWSLPKQKTKPNDNITVHTHLDDWSASLPFDCSWADNRTKDDKIWQWQNGLILQEQNPDETFLDTFTPPSCYFFHVFHTTFCMHNNPKKNKAYCDYKMCHLTTSASYSSINRSCASSPSPRSCRRHEGPRPWCFIIYQNRPKEYFNILSCIKTCPK